MSGLIYVVLLLAIVLTSLLIVRIGAVGLRITGLDPEIASFQALSAFTGTGFTTSEADLITRHPKRRRTVRILIIVGNAYFAAVVAMVISAIMSFSVEKKHLVETFVIYLVVIVLGLLVIYQLSISKRFSRWLDHYIEKRLARSKGFRIYRIQRVLDLAGGYTVGEFRVPTGSWMAGRSLQDLALGQYKILVLAVERGLRLVRTPTAETTIEENDNLICYGPVDGLEVLQEGPKTGRNPEDAKAAEGAQAGEAEGEREF